MFESAAASVLDSWICWKYHLLPALRVCYGYDAFYGDVRCASIADRRQAFMTQRDYLVSRDLEFRGLLRIIAL